MLLQLQQIHNAQKKNLIILIIKRLRMDIILLQKNTNQKTKKLNTKKYYNIFLTKFNIVIKKTNLIELQYALLSRHVIVAV